MKNVSFQKKKTTFLSKNRCNSSKNTMISLIKKVKQGIVLMYIVDNQCFVKLCKT
jgi:hypothetical protein